MIFQHKMVCYLRNTVAERTSWVMNAVSGISGAFPYAVFHEFIMIHVENIYFLSLLLPFKEQFQNLITVIVENLSFSAQMY